MGRDDKASHLTRPPAHQGLAEIVVVILAEGGEQARALLATIPRDQGWGVVLFPRSAAASFDGRDLLSAPLPIPVVLAEEGMPLLRDRIHLPPKDALGIAAGRLRVPANAPSDPLAAFDEFLQALAETHGARTVVVLPSSAAGAPGAQSVRQRGARLVTAEEALAPAFWSTSPLTGNPAGIPRPGILRDHAALHLLRAHVLPAAIAARRPAGAALRLWLPAGGAEDAYMLAMAASEAAAAAGLDLKILVTSLDGAVIDRARLGQYPPEAVAAMPPSYARQYLREEGGAWHVSDALRSCLVFGTHDLLHDPPFSFIDLILWPPPLHAFDPSSRTRLLSTFHSALNPSGLLHLAPDGEIPADAGFETLAGVPHVLRRLDMAETPDAPPPRRPAAPPTSADIELATRAATEGRIPASLLIDPAAGVLATVGPVERFLDVAAGDRPADIPSRAAPWLRRSLSDVLAKAWRSGQDQSRRALRPSADLSAQTVAIHARHLRDGNRALLLVSLDDHAPPPQLPFPGSVPGDLTAPEVSEILREAMESQRLELATLRRQASLAREEAISAGEELATALADLHRRSRDLEVAHRQLDEERERRRRSERFEEILRSCGVAMLLLDPALSIRFFTPSALLPFHMIDSDIGRPLADIAPLLHDLDLLDQAQRVLATREAVSRELEGPDGTWLLRGIQPCFDRHETVTGVVVTYADIRETKAAANRAAALRGMAADILQSVHRPLVMLDANLHVVFANDAFRESIGVDGKYDDENTLRVLIAPALRALPQLATFLTGRDDQIERIDDCVIQTVLPVIGLRTLRLGVVRVPPARTLIAIEDITDRVLMTASLENAKAAAEHVNREKSRLLGTVSRDLRPPLRELAELQRNLGQMADHPGLSRQLRRLEIGFREMSGILDALQGSAQLDLGAVNVNAATFALGALLDEIDEDFAEEARLRGLQWRVIRCDRAMISDAPLLRQALRSLITVLLRYTATGRILVGCRHRGDVLCLEIWSEGLQIPLPLLRAAFDSHAEGQRPGESSDASRLGLEVARRLSELLGHPIHVESRSPAGPTFLLELPTGVHPRMRALAGSAPDGLRPVLIVGETTPLAQSLRALLEQDGYAAMLASDAPYAIGLAVERPPSLIVAEYALPGRLNGLALAQRIGEAQDPPPPAILLTGDLPGAALRDIAKADFEHLPLSTSPKELLELIRRRLPRPGAAATAPVAAALGQVFIVNSDATLRLGMAEWLQNHGWIAESFASAEAFLDSDTPERRGCVLADWSMAGVGGLALLDVLRPLSHRLPVIMLSDQGDIRLAVRAISAGAIDFIARPVQHDVLLRSVEKAMLQVASSARQQASRTQLTARLASLTQRQNEILERIVAGMPNKIIAAELNLSQRTVENHRAALMSKLGARSLSELIRIVVAAR